MLDVPSITIFGFNIVKFAVDLGNAYMLFLVVSLSLNLEAGYTGVPNFGKVMFMAGGAAISAAVCGQLAVFMLGVNVHGNYNGYIVTVINQVNASLSKSPLLSVELVLLGTILAAGIGGLLGFLASYPAIRLREDYLGMLLLASAQFFQIFLGAYYPLIGGTQGISVPDFFGWAGNGIGVRDVAILGFLSVFALLVYIYAERIARSPLGRTLRAVRDNETATRALGKNDVAIRRNVIIIASAIAAMAGALLTFQVASIGPGTWDRITWTFYIWVMVIIGGSGNNLGVALGALSFTSLFDVITQVQNSLPSDLPIEVNWLRYLLFATLLISILAFRPGGILPEKSSLTIQKNRLSRIIKSANVLEERTGSSSGEKFAADSIPRDSKTTD
jgi:branched-chain amino acid transport system permease protein